MMLQRLPSRLSPRSQSRFYADVRPLAKPPGPQPADSSRDLRPPWVYRMSRILHFTLIPSVAFYCVFFADFGEREHVFMPARRWAATQKAAFYTLSPAEEKMLRDEVRQQNTSRPTKSPIS